MELNSEALLRDPSVPSARENSLMDQTNTAATRTIVYDGYCHLCSGWARFHHHHPATPPFELVPMQSPRGRELLTMHGADPAATARTRGTTTRPARSIFATFRCRSARLRSRHWWPPDSATGEQRQSCVRTRPALADESERYRPLQHRAAGALLLVLFTHVPDTQPEVAGRPQ